MFEQYWVPIFLMKSVSIVQMILIYAYFVFNINWIYQPIILVQLWVFLEKSLHLVIHKLNSFKELALWIFGIMSAVCVLYIQFQKETKLCKFIVILYWNLELINSIRIFSSIRVMIEVIEQTIGDIIAYLQVLMILVLQTTLLHYITVKEEKQTP